MTRRSDIKTIFAEQLATANSRVPSDKSDGTRLQAGPVRTMSMTLDKIEAETLALQETLASGANVVDIDPHSIEASFAADRFADSDEISFSKLKASIQENGQEVPILVRPLQGSEGRYQVAYGHRRLRAARELGVQVRAIIRPLTDPQLVIAQGVENSARLDLTYIEKAVFARSLEERGFDRATIMTALSTDKTELSKLVTAAKGLPEKIVRAIGAAPKAGRRRWLQLAELVKNKTALRRAELAISDPDFNRGNSDTRFLRVLGAAMQSDNGDTDKGRRPVKNWTTPEGQTLGRFSRDRETFTLRINETIEPSFAEFIIAELDSLLAKFRSQSR